jgi:kynurenine formamidase
MPIKIKCPSLPGTQLFAVEMHARLAKDVGRKIVELYFGPHFSTHIFRQSKEHEERTATPAESL